MNLNEITNTHFEYSLVSDETAMLLKSKKNQLDGIYFRYTSEVGQVLYEAQQELADYNNDGLFAKWVEAAGFKRQRAYEYINIYKYAVRITDNDELEIFEKQPKSIQTEMSKPSANPEINQAVFSGDITTHKEYKEREKEFKKQLKQQAEQHQRQLAEKDEVINKTYEQLEKAQSKEPEVIEKVVEVLPPDYQSLKEANEALSKQLNNVSSELKLSKTKYDLLESTTAEAKELERKINSMKTQEKTLMDKMQAIDDFQQLESEFNEFFDTNMAPMRFKSISDYLYATNALERIRSMINKADLWVDEMNKLIPNSNIKIIEGEFTDE